MVSLCQERLRKMWMKMLNSEWQLGDWLPITFIPSTPEEIEYMEFVRERVKKDMKGKIYYNYKHQPVGEMKNGFYVKRVDPKKHFMRNYQGYGISQSIFEELKNGGCKEIRINTGDDLYRIPIQDFEVHSIKA